MKAFAILLLVGIGLTMGCSDDAPTGAGNRTPVIRSLSANPTEINRTEYTDLTAIATDEDSDGIDYFWSCDSGSFRYLHGSTAGWIAPRTPGSYYVKLTITDRKAIDSDSIAVMVNSLWPNNPPTVPYSPSPGNGGYIGRGTSNINLYWNCNDADGDSLQFDVYFGVESLNSLIFVQRNLTVKGIHVSDLVPNTHYVWRVIVRDSRGAEVNGPTWSFYTN